MVDLPDATTAVTRTTTAVTSTSVTTRNTGMSPIAMPTVLQLHTECHREAKIRL